MPVENVFCNVSEWLTIVFYVYVYKEFMHECYGNDLAVGSLVGCILLF